MKEGTALKITEDIIPNTIVKEAIAVTREDVTDGKTLGGISRPGKPRPGKRPPGNRLLPRQNHGRES